MKIPLYSYKSPLDKDDSTKLRPGFRIDGTLFVLTHTRPHVTGSEEVSSDNIDSEHFKTKNLNVFLTYSTKNPLPKKYNNKIGGYLILDEKSLEFIENIEPNVKQYIISSP